MDVNTPSPQLEIEKNILVKLYYTEDQHARAQSEHAASLYGGNSLTDTALQVHQHIVKPAMASHGAREQQLNNWAAAHTAARKSQIHAETARRLREKESQLNVILAEQARRASEAAAIAHAQAVAQEQAHRLAAEAAERERVAAEAEAARTAEAAERARVEAEAEAARTAEQANQAAETARIAEAQAEEASANAGVLSAGTLIINQPTMITASGTAIVSTAATGALQAAVRSAVAAIGGAVVAGGAAIASGFLVGVSALLYPSELGNGDLPEGYAFSTPLTDLLPESDHEQSLNTLAEGATSIKLPHRLGATLSEEGHQELILAKTDGLAVPADVRVVAATFDTEKNAYTVTTDDLPPRTFVWTPIINPGNSSTESPTEAPTNPFYLGATLIPASGQLEKYPSAEQIGFRDLITTFPADSGIDPIYTVFNHLPGDLIFDEKITDQLADRGWNEDTVRALITLGPTGTSVDKRRARKTPDGLPRDDTATVYGTAQGGYIVVNDRTGEVVQISGKNTEAWFVDDRIKWSDK